MIHRLFFGRPRNAQYIGWRGSDHGAAATWQVSAILAGANGAALRRFVGNNR
jgi:hypothetical protein